MIELEQKSKAQKIPGPKINPPKNPMHNYTAGIRGQTTNNNFQLNQAIRENFCQIFLSYPKKNPKSKISNPKNPSIKPFTWNPEYYWGFVPPQFRKSRVLLMTYFITAKQIVEYEAESERPTSKTETTTNGKRTKYLLFFWNRNTLNSKTKNPQLRWKGRQSTKMGQLVWSVTIPFRHLRCLWALMPTAPWGIWNQTSVSGRGEYSRVLHF